MKKTALFLLMILALLSLLSACDYEGDEQKGRITAVLQSFKDALNAQDKGVLNELISDEYVAQGLDKTQFIQTLLSQKLYINGANLEEIKLNEQKNQAVVVAGWRSSGPELVVRVPIFMRDVPSVNTEVLTRTRFHLQKEGGAQWRVIASEQLNAVTEGRSGQFPPRLANVQFTPDSPRRGESVDLRVRLEKGSELSSVFLSVNGVPIGGFSQMGLTSQELNDAFIQIFRIPEDHPAGRTYDIELLAFEGKIDPLQIYLSELNGLHYKKIQLAVR